MNGIVPTRGVPITSSGVIEPINVFHVNMSVTATMTAATGLMKTGAALLRLARRHNSAVTTLNDAYRSGTDVTATTTAETGLMKWNAAGFNDVGRANSNVRRMDDVSRDLIDVTAITTAAMTVMR